MATLNVSLPKELKEFVDDRVSAGDSSSASAFIAALVRAERRRRAEEKLLALVKEADESGSAGPMTASDWERIRREIAEGIANRKKKKARKP